jgi:putative protease
MPNKKTTKKAVKKIAKKVVVKKEKKIGKIKHYFSAIKVAVIKLKEPLKEGDKIRITGGEDTNFIQQVKSMQVDHKKVKLAKKGKSIGLKVSKKAREGYDVYKI